MNEKIEAFHELWQNQNIAVHTSLGSASVRMNAELADILLNNLLSNATKHNYPNGSISIELDNKQLKVANTSAQAELDQGRLFSRFQKQVDGIEQHGLGLSIVKRICDASGFNIYYFFTERQHSFVVSWT
jgi:signal transduction histidine kinase